MKVLQIYFCFFYIVLLLLVEELCVEFCEFFVKEKEVGIWECLCKFWGGWKLGFFKVFGGVGYFGMMWFKEYGGGGCLYLECYVLIEELFVVGVLLGFYWIVDWQLGFVILCFGIEEQKCCYLFGIIVGEIFYCIGMSEFDLGLDFVLVCMCVVCDGDGWWVIGIKIWIFNVYCVDYCIFFCWIEELFEKCYVGLSQFIVDFGMIEGFIVWLIFNIVGLYDFNEVVFDNVYLLNDCLFGEFGNGWEQVISELLLECVGLDCFLMNFVVFSDFVGVFGDGVLIELVWVIGCFFSYFLVLCKVLILVVGLFEVGELLNVELVIVKDFGMVFQQEFLVIVCVVVLVE